uniref:Uncharacterized protein n=1 Tax=Heliothis virescens TaxID=7102 RepID=A0A2A4J881_HELVI
MKKSYHKLKRSKAIPNTYTENIGEGKKKKLRKSKQSGDDTKKLDQLDVEQKIIKDSFVAEKKAIKDNFVAEKKAIKDSIVAEKKAIKDSFDAEKKAIKDSFVTEKKAIKDSFVAEKKAAQKHKPEKKTMAPITAIGSRDNKNPMKDSKGSRERNISPVTQNPEHRIKKIRNQNSEDSSSASATSIRKDKKKPFNKIEPETQNPEHIMKKIRNQNSKDSSGTSATSIRKDNKKPFNKTEPETQNTEHRMKKIRNQNSKDSSGTSATSIRKDNKKPFNKTEPETQKTEHRMKKIRNQNSKDSPGTSATSIRKDKKKPFNKTEPETQNTEHRMKKIRNQNSKDSPGTSVTSIRKDKKKTFNKTERETQNTEHRMKKIRNQHSKDSSGTSATSIRKDKKKPFNETEPVTQNPEHRIKKIRNQHSKDSSGTSATSIRKDKKKPFNETEPVTQNPEHRIKKIRNQKSKDSSSTSATSIRKDKRKPFNKTEPVTQNPEHRIKKIRNQNSKDSSGASATSIRKDKKKPFNKTEPETQNTEHRLKKIRNQNSKDSFSASATSIRKDKKKLFNKTEPVTQNTEHRMKKIRNQNSKDSFGTSATSIGKDKKKPFNKTEPETQNTEHRLKKIRNQNSKDSFSASATSIRKDKKKPFNKTEPVTQNTEHRMKKIRNQNSKDSSGTSATSIRKDKKKLFNKTEPVTQNPEHRIKKIRNQKSKDSSSTSATKPTSTINEQLKNQSQKRNKSNVLNELVGDMKKKLKGHRAIQETNQTKKPRNGVLASALPQKKRSFRSATSLPSISSVSGKPGKQLAFSIDQGKETKTNATRSPRKIPKSISTSSIEKSYSALRLPSPPERFVKSGVRKGSPKTQQPDRNNWTSHQERTSSRELFRENEKTLVKSFSSKENKTKAESPVPFRRQLRFPSAPERFVKSAVPKDSPKAQQPDRNNRTSHQEITYSRELFRQHEKTLQRQKFRQREGSHQRKGSQRDESYNPDKSLKRDDPSYSRSPKRQEQVKSTTELEKSRPRRKSQQRGIIFSHKSEILKPILKKDKANSPDITRQEVMSNFPRSSMNTKRHSYSPADKDSKIKKDSYQRSSKDIELKDYKSSESLLGNDKKQDRSLLLGSTVKRCLCALKIYKNGKTNEQSIAVNTDTIPNSIPDKKYPVTQSKLSNQFTQYESKYSKPSVFMTNNFNTCECLQETKKRKKLKSFGIGTKKIKMVSKSSETRALGGTSNHLFSKSNFRTREISLQKFRNMRKCSGLCNWSAHTNERNPNWRQSIKINSNFSVNINIYEDTAHDSDIHYHDQESKNIVHRLSDNFKSLLKIKSPKTSGCICALELKKDEQRRGSKVLSPFSFTKKPNQVYTVSTVAMAETKIIAPKMPKMLTLKDVEDCRSVDSDDHTDNNKQALKQKNQWDYCDIKSTAVISTSKFAITAKNMQSCIFENAYETRKENSLKLSSRETVTIKSKFNCELNYVKTECFKDKRIHRNALYTNSTCELNEFAIENIKADTDVKKDVLIQTDHINRNHLTGVQPLLRRCYCTMNIQVAGQQSTKRRYRHSSKLKDYECEPGVCVPYECDPYECQKRIMRRLMKKVSTMSGTEKRLKTSASLTSSMKSVSRTRGLQSSYAHEQRHSQPKSSPMGLKYQTLPRTLRTHREAVRIGSNFSFDMEFSKRSTSPAKAKAPRLSTASRSSITSDRHHRDRGTKGFGEERQHRESQSTRRQMRHRGSSVKPMLRRCFCTLKLQKKGRQQKQIELQNQGTSTPPKFQVEKPILRTTETGQNTRAKQRYPELLPYECEPGICVPGECDPYNCLELIKRRKGNYTKDFGTESIASRTTSSSSMTPSQNRRRKQVQSRNVRVRPPKPRVTEVTSKPSVTSSGRQLTPSRQAVRIGSSFSFNIEFYKDNTSPGDNVKRSPESYAHKTPRHVRTVPKYVHTRRATREDYSQRIKPTRDFDSQIGTRTHGQSTMTSGFLKRCFCTAKLQGNNHDTQTSHQKSSALKRCLCKFSSYIKDHSPPDNVGHESVPPVVEKHVIMTQTRRLSPTLLPYECEPGVCVPGFCDPYQCEKLIRRRLQGRMAGTEGPKTRSVSSSCTPCKAAKAGMTQFRSPRPPEHIRRRDHSPREMVIEDRVRSPALSRRQAVKYGSSFNFDIEFYKGKSPNYHQVQAATTVQRYRPSRKRDHGVYYGHRTRDMGTRGRGISVQNRDSQMFAARKRDTAIGTILRRCFCTLQLKRQLENDIQNQSKKDQQKQPKNKKQKQSIKDTQKQVKKDKQKQSKKVKQKQSKNDTKNQVKKGKSRVVKPATSQSRTVMTLNRLKRFHYNLEPYECEPGVCVPGECDPYECEKRIKNRGMHSSETLTEHYPTKSTSNMTRNHRQHRYSETPFVRRKPLRMNGVNYRERPKYSRVVESPSKQVVKIGSSFNFDIEFFKNKSPAGGLVTSRPEKRGRRRTTSRSTEWRSLPSRNKWAQGSRTMHDMNSQAFSRKMRSTMTGAGPFLKRCFCTLQLQKSENNTNHSDSASVSSVTKKEKPLLKQNPNCKCAEKSTNTIKQRVVVAEPAISQSRTVTTPDRLKRLHYKLEPYECEPGVCVPGECDPYECEKRIKKRMWAKQSGTEPSKTRSVSRSIGADTESRGSGMGPFLKRCFCTLTLQRAEVTSKPNSPTTLSLKKTSTKKTNNPPQAPTQDLEPNECEPGVCEPAVTIPA